VPTSGGYRGHMREVEVRELEVDDPLGSLVRAGRLAPPADPRPERAPQLVKTSRPASPVVLAERGAER
jgi:hypothetical protein